MKFDAKKNWKGEAGGEELLAVGALVAPGLEEHPARLAAARRVAAALAVV
jgi:hypothetical protein